jgi:hypothetical protein
MKLLFKVGSQRERAFVCVLMCRDERAGDVELLSPALATCDGILLCRSLLSCSVPIERVSSTLMLSVTTPE